jgi:hypothetical protein
MTVLWPVFVDRAPIAESWHVGDSVSISLRWCDSPDLPDDVVVRDVVMHARPCHGRDGRPWGQLLRTGTLAAARPGQHEAGEVMVSGCLYHDRGLAAAVGGMPSTSGEIRRIRVVMDLHDRGADRWIRRPGATRIRDVPDTSPEHLRGEHQCSAARSTPLWTRTVRSMSSRSELSSTSSSRFR